MEATAKYQKNYFILIVIGLCIFLHGCSPIFSDLQSARTVGKGKSELTPSGTYVSTNSWSDNEMIQRQVGFQYAKGLTDGIDLRARVEFVNGITAIGIGPKFSLLKDYISFYVPVGRALGVGYGETWQMHPTLFYTIPLLENKLEVNFSTKYIKTFCDDCYDTYAMNLGLGMSSDFSKWCVRPETGLLFDPLSGMTYRHVSIGISFGLGK